MDSKEKLLLVINPIAGSSGKDQLMADITSALQKHKADFTTYETTGEDDETHIKNLLETENITNVLVAGGDGTIQNVAKTIGSKDIALSLIPAGSANGLASNLKIPDDVTSQIAIALGSNFVMSDMIDINGHLCLHIADLGINALLIKNYDNSTLRGKLGYALQTIPTLIESDLPYRFSIQTDEKTVSIDGVMIAIANAQQFGTGAVINPEGKIDDGKFEVLVFKNLNIINILKTLDKNSYRNPEFVESFSTKKAVITCAAQVAFQVDGEYIGDVANVEAKLMPTKLKIKVPENFA